MILIEEIKTNNGKLYVLGTIFGISTVIISLIHAIGCLNDKTKFVDIEIIILNYIFSFGLLLKLPYIYNNILSRISTIILIIGILSSATIYLIAYIKKY